MRAKDGNLSIPLYVVPQTTGTRKERAGDAYIKQYYRGCRPDSGDRCDGRRIAKRRKTYPRARGLFLYRASSTHCDGDAGIAAQQAYRIAALSGAQTGLKLGQRADALVVERVNDVARAKAVVPGSTVTLHCRDDQSLNALVERAAALDFDHLQARE